MDLVLAHALQPQAFGKGRRGGLADGPDHDVGRHDHLGAGIRHGAAASVLVRLAQVALDALDARDLAALPCLAAQDAHGRDQLQPVPAGSLKLLDLVAATGGLPSRPAIEHAHPGRALAQRPVGHVDGRKARADDHHVLARHLDARHAALVVLGRADGEQERQARVHAGKLLAGHVELARLPGAGAEHHGVVPAHQFVQVDAAGGELVAGVVHLPAVADLGAGVEGHAVVAA